MRFVLIAASNRPPSWVEEAFAEYAKRLRGGVSLELKELALARRRDDPARARRDEGRRMLRAIPEPARVVALCEQGRQWSTAELVGRLTAWLEGGMPVCFLVGGPDGLSDDCVARADEHWGLSRLTLPHRLARVVVAEALYRAWNVTRGHPYHRA